MSEETAARTSVMSIYVGSNGDETKALYQKLEAMGPLGVVAMNLFRVQKASARAKVYRGGTPGRGSYKSQAYDKKNWSLRELCTALRAHGEFVWGWKEDPAQEFHSWVLYVELPTRGQVSFHAASALSDERYHGEWDGVLDICPWRIVQFVADVLEKCPVCWGVPQEPGVIDCHGCLECDFHGTRAGYESLLDKEEDAE